jgi:hypothetical protein
MWLSLIPTRAWLAVVALAALAGIYGLGHHAGARAVQAEWDAERAALVVKAAEQAASVKEIAHAADLSREHLVADADAARSAADRLRLRVRALAARCSAAAADPGAPASAPGDLLADVQRRIDAAAGVLAEHADRSRLAGLACERSYEVTSP